MDDNVATKLGQQQQQHNMKYNTRPKHAATNGDFGNEDATAGAGVGAEAEASAPTVACVCAAVVGLEIGPLPKTLLRVLCKQLASTLVQTFRVATRKTSI